VAVHILKLNSSNLHSIRLLALSRSGVSASRVQRRQLGAGGVLVIRPPITTADY
jgi:hypothetical protein